METEVVVEVKEVLAEAAAVVGLVVAVANWMAETVAAEGRHCQPAPSVESLPW